MGRLIAVEFPLATINLIENQVPFSGGAYSWNEPARV